MSYSRGDMERDRVVSAALRWVTREHGQDDGFAEWYWGAGREDSYPGAHVAWLASPARIERWAERHGVFPPRTRGFARWYVRTGRTDSWTQAYEVFRSTPSAAIVAELKTVDGCPTLDSMV